MASGAPKAVSQRSERVLIALVWLAGLGAAAQFGKVAAALPAFAEVYDVSPVGLGFFVSSVGVCGLIFGVAGGVIVDRLGLRRSLVWGLAVGGLLSLVQALLPPFEVMIGLRLLEGAAHLAIVVAGPVLMSAYASEGARAAVMTLWSTFFGVSYMLVALAAGPLIEGLGLSGYLAAHGGYLLVMAAVLLAAMPPPVPRERAKALSLGDWGAVHLRIYRSPWIAAPGLGFVWYTMMYIALLAFLPGFVGEAVRAPMAGAMPLASIAVSLTFGIVLLRFLPPVPVAQIGFVVTALMALSLIWALGTDAVFFVIAVLLMGVTGLIPGASFAALSHLNSDLTDRAHATGALAQLGNVGTTTGPPLLAAVVTGFGLPGLVAFVLILSGIGVMMHGWLALRRRVSTEA